MKLQKPVPTSHVISLARALRSRGLEVEVEYFDGHKHVDMAILKAKLFIEVDGLQHFIDPEEIEKDIKRDHFSDGDDFATLHFTNQLIEKYPERIADAVAQVVRDRITKFQYF